MGAVDARLDRRIDLITTLPIFCPDSTYRYASTIWSRRIPPVDDRPELSRLEHFLEPVTRAWLYFGGIGIRTRFPLEQRRDERQDRVLGKEAEVRRDVEPARRQQSLAPTERALADRVQDHVVRLLRPS